MTDSNERYQGGLHVADRNIELCNLTASVTAFKKAMLDRLRLKIDESYTGWDDPKCRKIIEERLAKHTEKLLAGDHTHAVDVANLAMMLYFLGDRIRTFVLNGNDVVATCDT